LPFPQSGRPENEQQVKTEKHRCFGIYCCIDCLTASGTPRLPSSGIIRFPARGLASGLWKNSVKIAIPSGVVRNPITSFLSSGDESFFPRITPSIPDPASFPVPHLKSACYKENISSGRVAGLYRTQAVSTPAAHSPDRGGRGNPCRYVLPDGQETGYHEVNLILFSQLACFSIGSPICRCNPGSEEIQGRVSKKGYRVGAFRYFAQGRPRSLYAGRQRCAADRSPVPP
jgi:hypothetical protein